MITSDPIPTIESFLIDVEALDKEIIEYKNNLELYYEKKVEIEKTREIREKILALYRQGQTLRQGQTSVNKIITYGHCDMLHDCLDNLDNLLKYRYMGPKYCLEGYVIPTMDTFWDLKFRLQNKFLNQPKKNGDSHIIDLNSKPNLNRLPTELIYSILKTNLNGTKAENKLTIAKYRLVSKRFRNIINAIDNTYISAIHFAQANQDELLPLKVYSNIFSNLDRGEQNKLRTLCKMFNVVIDAIDPELAMLRSLHSTLHDRNLNLSTFRDTVEQASIKEIELDQTYFFTQNRENETYQYYKKLLAKLAVDINKKGWNFRDNNNSDYSLAFGCLNLAPFLLSLFTTIGVFAYEMNYLWDHCFPRDFDVALCQQEANTTMALQFSRQFIWGSTIGFLSKAIANFAFASTLHHCMDNNLVVPTYPKQFTPANNIIYKIVKFFHDSIFYREIPVLATAIYLTSLVKERKGYSLDIKDCDNGRDLHCMVTIMDEKRNNDFTLNFMDGFLYAYATLSLLYLLYRFVTTLCDKGKNICHASNPYRLFPPSQPTRTNNVISEEQEEEEDNEMAKLLKPPR